MNVLHKKSGVFHEAIIELVEDEDWLLIDKFEQFSFDWNKEKEYLAYKISLILEEKILGLISVEEIPKELRLHIRLIESSKSNRGISKEYDYVAGCLIAHICEISFDKGVDGFVSLEPKTELIELYQNKYGFKGMGQFLYTELSNSERLIKKYLGDENE